MKLLLLGATGLVGAQVLQQALRDSRVTRVTAPVRRPLPPAEKLHTPLMDFGRLPEDEAWWRADAAICALGTTRRRAGSADAFRQVDHDLVLAIARLARQHGTSALALVSARGADKRSPLLYPRVKGEVEDAVTALGFPSLTILRPGLIGGERDERRPVEHLVQRLLKRLHPVLPAGWRINPAPRIALLLLEAALAGAPGRHAVSSEELV